MTIRRTMIIIIAGLIAVGWAVVPITAYAGGPTSALLVRLNDQRAIGLYHTDPAYDRLVNALDAYGSATGPDTAPGSVGAGGSEAARATWLIHDQQIWRIDRIYPTADDGVWVQTVSDPTGGDPFDRPGVWHRPADPTALLAILSASSTGAPAPTGSPALTTPTTPLTGSGSPTTQRAGTSGLMLPGAALVGALLGVGGTLIVRRPRPEPAAQDS